MQILVRFTNIFPHKIHGSGFQGRQGEIRHVYRSFVFVFCRTYPENGGMFVCRARHLVKPGGKTAHPMNNMSGGLSPYMRSPAGMMSPSHSSSGRPKQTGGQSFNNAGPGGGIRRDMKIIGKEVKITGGPHKGNYGIVKDATEQTAKVELHSGCKHITVDRSRLGFVGLVKKN